MYLQGGLRIKQTSGIIWCFICDLTHIKYKMSVINPFKPVFTIVTFIHYKQRIAVAIRDL